MWIVYVVFFFLRSQRVFLDKWRPMASSQMMLYAFLHHPSSFPINSQSVDLWGWQTCIRVSKGSLLGFLSALSESLQGHLVFHSLTSASKHYDRRNILPSSSSLNTGSLSATTAWTTYFITKSWYNKIVVILLLLTISPSLLMLHFPDWGIYVLKWCHLPSWITRFRYASTSTETLRSLWFYRCWQVKIA